MTVRAIIPARSGSIRIPGKNLQKIAGVSLVRQSLIVANKTPLIDVTYLDTDSEEICNECKDLDVHILGLRPPHLSSSSTTTFDSLFHFLTKALKGLDESDTLVLLQPTCPFRTTTEITQAIELFEKNKKCYPVICVSEPFLSPKDFISLSYEGFISEFNLRGMDLKNKKIFYDTGSIYVTTLGLLRQHKGFVKSGKTLAIETNQINGFDIDTPLQLNIARLLVANGDAELQKFPK